jgi:hypothetical protein
MVKFHQHRCLLGLVDCFISLLAEFEFDSFLLRINFGQRELSILTLIFLLMNSFIHSKGEKVPLP